MLTTIHPEEVLKGLGFEVDRLSAGMATFATFSQYNGSMPRVFGYSDETTKSPVVFVLRQLPPGLPSETTTELLTHFPTASQTEGSTDDAPRDASTEENPIEFAMDLIFLQGTQAFALASYPQEAVVPIPRQQTQLALQRLVDNFNWAVEEVLKTESGFEEVLKSGFEDKFAKNARQDPRLYLRVLIRSMGEFYGEDERLLKKAYHVDKELPELALPGSCLYNHYNREDEDNNFRSWWTPRLGRGSNHGEV